MQSSAASSTGNCSGAQPAITALTATFSTVASPNPGSITITTSWGARRVPCSIAATAAGVGGITGIPSLQSRSSKKRLTASRPAGESSSVTVKVSRPPPPLILPPLLPATAVCAVSVVSPAMMPSICSSTIRWM